MQPSATGNTILKSKDKDGNDVFAMRIVEGYPKCTRWRYGVLILRLSLVSTNQNSHISLARANFDPNPLSLVLPETRLLSSFSPIFFLTIQNSSRHWSTRFLESLLLTDFESTRSLVSPDADRSPL